MSILLLLFSFQQVDHFYILTFISHCSLTSVSTLSQEYAMLTQTSIGLIDILLLRTPFLFSPLHLPQVFQETFCNLFPLNSFSAYSQYYY